MPLVRRLRLPAVLCALAVLICELIARPYANMGICDDGPYILVAQKLAATGHVAYNGWSAAMLLWQLYVGAAFVKLLGFSFTTVRMSTLLVAVLMAFFLQRTLVLADITERNATLGTLALVLSPLYLLLSVTFMSDIHGLFGIVLCLYGCLRALRAPSANSSVGWLCFAVAASAIIGTSRQLTWLGVLVMVPCTLWLLRSQRRVLLGGVAANLAGFVSVFACMLWLKRQPYTTPEQFGIGAFNVSYTLRQFTLLFLDIPFLLLPVGAVFLPQIFKSRRRVLAAALLVLAIFLAVYPSHLRGRFEPLLEPTFHDWVTDRGGFDGMVLKGTAPSFLDRGARGFLALASLGGLIGLIASSFNAQGPRQDPSAPAERLSWKSLGILLGPFALAYTLLLVYRALTIAGAGTPEVIDRYALGLLVVALIAATRYYQDGIDPRLPRAAAVLVAITAMYGVAVTHNTFALYRARVSLMTELRAAGVPDTSVDNGWDYNLDVELQHASHINNDEIVLPADAYVPMTDPPAGTCEMFWYRYTPHIDARYGVSFDPNACYGPAPFAPVHYNRWLASKPGTLYVVNYRVSSKQ